MKITGKATVRTVAFFIFLILLSCKTVSAGFQDDADIIRLRHIQYYGNLIEEYNQETGHYPFQGREEVPLYVYVANDEQIGFTKKGSPNTDEEISFKEFVNEIESVLGREIDEYYDPQYRPVYKPNFYMYMIIKDKYFFAVHVSQPYTFAKKVAKNYYKIEISNHSNSQNQAKDPEELFNSQAFLEELTEPVSKEGFFKVREDKYLHYSKTTN